MSREFDPTLGYLLYFDGHGTYTTEGRIDYTKEEADEHNRIYDRCNIDGLDRCPVGKGGCFYVEDKTSNIITFIGTVIAPIESQSGKSNARTVRFKRNGMEFSGKYNERDGNCCFFVRRK